MGRFRDLFEAKGDGHRKKLLRLIPSYIKDKTKLRQEEAKALKIVKKKFGKSPNEISYLDNPELVDEIRLFIDDNYSDQVEEANRLRLELEKISGLLYKLPYDSEESNLRKEIGLRYGSSLENTMTEYIPHLEKSLQKGK